MDKIWVVMQKLKRVLYSGFSEGQQGVEVEVEVEEEEEEEEEEEKEDKESCRS